ncbi:hypothetical protein ACKWTF_011193 [Chironomus riparius]
MNESIKQMDILPDPLCKVVYPKRTKSVIDETLVALKLINIIPRRIIVHFSKENPQSQPECSHNFIIIPHPPTLIITSVPSCFSFRKKKVLHFINCQNQVLLKRKLCLLLSV